MSLITLFTSKHSKIFLFLVVFITKSSLSISFVGRKYELSSLRNYINEGIRTITITGVSGIGKTALAREFSKLNKSKYDLIYWFYGSENFEEGIVNLGRYLDQSYGENLVNVNCQQAINVKRVLAYLSNTKKRVLFVFDNFQDISNIDLIPARKNFTFIITSLNRFNTDKVMILKNLSKEDSVRFIRSVLHCSLTEASSLADTLNCYPLALMQAVSYISSTPGMNVERYVKIYNESYKDVWGKEEALVKEGVIDRSVYSTLSLTLENLRKINEPAYRLIYYFALQNKNVPFSVLKNIYLTSIHNKEIDFFDALTVLHKYSLVETSGLETFSCHDMVAKFLKTSLDSESCKRIVENALLSCAKFRYLRPSEGNYYDQNVPEYFRTLTKEAKLTQVLNHIEDLLIKCFHFFLMEKRDYIRAEEVAKELEDYYGTNLENVNKARYHLLKGILFAWRHADYAKSNIEYNTALAILKNFVGHDSDILDIQIQLAQNYCFMGDLEMARECVSQAEKLTKNGTKDISGTLKWIVAIVDLYSGEYESALHKIQDDISALLDKAVLDQSIVIPCSHYDSDILYGRTLIRAGRLDEAHIKLNKLYTSFEKAFSTKMHDTYMSLCANLADLSKQRKDLQSMKYYLDEMHSRLDKIYDKEEINQAEYHRLLGDYYFALKNYNLAYHNYDKADRIYARIFVKFKHDDIKHLWKQKICASYKLGLEEEYAHCMDKYRDTFGDSDLKEIVKLAYE